MTILIARLAIGVAGASLAAGAAIAQTRINPTDPQPSCEMCPGYYIPVDEIEAYTQKAIAEQLTDQQIRDVDIGKAHLAVGVVHRGKLDAPRPDSVAEHDLVSEVYIAGPRHRRQARAAPLGTRSEARGARRVDCHRDVNAVSDGSSRRRR